MTLTNRGAWVLIMLCMAGVIACGVVGQHMKAERLAAEQSADR